MSLRARLIVGLVVVVLAGLAGANVTTYVVVRGFLLDRIDDQLVQAADPISREIDRQRNATPYPDGTYPYPQREGSRDRGIPPTSFPPGTYGEIRNADGTSSSLVLGFGTSYAPPKLPEELDISEATFLSVDATDGSFRYRVLARTISDGRVLFTAVPMTSVDQTMNDLRTTSLGVSAAVVLVVAALGFFTSARIAEQVRAGIQSLPKGQRYAGMAVGFTTVQTYRYVILPMAFRIILPPLTSESMNLLKNSSVAFAVSISELTMFAMQAQEETSRGVEVYLAVTALYAVSAFAVNRIMAFVERRVQIPGFIVAGGTGGGH